VTGENQAEATGFQLIRVLTANGRKRILAY